MNKKTSVIFGAGSVGRGFIGQLFSESGFHVVFVDVVAEIVEGINLQHSYPHITVSTKSQETKTIGPVEALFSSDEKQVVAAIAEAEIIATAVGASVLPLIAPMLAKGLQQRVRENKSPVNIMLCENLHHAAKTMQQLLLSQPGIDPEWFEKNVGLLETSIGRMIPVPSDETRAIHPAAVCVEPYKELPYDVHAVKGVMPHVVGLEADTHMPFTFYTDRKLYIHNLGHCTCAFLGEVQQLTFIDEAIRVPEIAMLVRTAMMESAAALSLKYNKPLSELEAYVDDLIVRFGNCALKDTITRVARDPLRKLAPGDRFFGAYALCREMHLQSKHITVGIACGLSKLMREADWQLSTCELYLQQNLGNTANEQNLIKDIISMLPIQDITMFI